jgi:predicted DNA-binding transcriptional regulator AlpA
MPESKQETNQQQEQLLTPEGVSTLTGIALDTLAGWRSRKEQLPYVKLGKCVRYRASDVRRWVESNLVTVDS